MSNVVQFPNSGGIQNPAAMELAKDFIATEMRMQLGAAVGYLHGKVTEKDKVEIIRHIIETIKLLDAMAGIEEACK